MAQYQIILYDKHGEAIEGVQSTKLSKWSVPRPRTWLGKRVKEALDQHDVEYVKIRKV